MSTRVVELKLSECRSEVEKFLTEKNYCLNHIGQKDELLTGKYAGPKRHRMLYQPVVEVDFARVSIGATCVAVSFPLRWKLVAILTTFWMLAGFAPILALGKVYPKDVQSVHLWWLSFVVSSAWLLVVTTQVALRRHVVDTHQKEMERLLWKYLDLDNCLSHEVADPSRSEMSFFRSCKWGFFLVTIVFGAILFWCIWLAISSPELGMPILFMVTMIFCCTLLVLLFFGWVDSFTSLPHRYHWKARFGVAYIGWWLITCLPIMVIAGIGFVRALSFKEFGTLSFSGIGYLMLIVMLLVLLLALGMLVLMTIKALQRSGSTERGRCYFVHPSTRYETISEQLNVSGTCSRRMFQRNRLWTWALFLYLTSAWYFATGYMVVISFEAVAGLLGAEWAIAQSWYWPVIVPTGNLGSAFQTAVLMSLAGTPLVLIVAQAVRSRLNMKRRLNLGQELAEGCTELGLPKGPLDFLKRELEADKLQVALVPIPKIDVRLERTAFFKKCYLLWVSVGARKQLSEKEIEAILWHECGHAGLVKRVGREVTAFLSPWAPRFLDITEDLYEQERVADRHVVEKMGTAEPLASALRKLKKQGRPVKERETKTDENTLAFLSWDVVKALWSLEWAGYLYPDVDQRIRWLKEGRDNFCQTGQTLD